jgi:hypothetical protein
MSVRVGDGMRVAAASDMPLTELRRAGDRLAEALLELHDVAPILVAIPRRGAIVGIQVARKLRLPLELVLGSPRARTRRDPRTLRSVPSRWAASRSATSARRQQRVSRRPRWSARSLTR